MRFATMPPIAGIVPAAAIPTRPGHSKAIEGKTPSMRKLYILMAVLSLVVAACGGDSGGDSCESVADEAIQAIQDVIDEVDSLTLEEFGAMDEEPEALADMERRAEELQQRADELGCSDAEMEELLNARVGNLEAEGMLGTLLIDELEGGGFFE